MIAELPGSNVKPLGHLAQDMLKAMRSASESLFAVSKSGKSPNGWAFVVPKKQFEMFVDFPFG